MFFKNAFIIQAKLVTIGEVAAYRRHLQNFN